MLGIFLGTFFSGIIGLIIFLYYLNKGQFSDMEDTKFQMFHEDEEKR